MPKNRDNFQHRIGSTKAPQLCLIANIMSIQTPHKAGPTVFICTRRGTGGAQFNATRVATSLREQGYPVELCFLYAADDTPAPEWARTYLPHPPKGLKQTAKMLLAILADLRRWKPHAVIGFHPLANIITAFSGLVAGCTHRVASHRNPPDSQRPLFRLLDKWLGTSPFYSSIICVSQDVANNFTRYPAAFQRKISVIHNGLPDRKASLSKTEARTKFNLPQDVFLLGNVARLHHQKNQAFLLGLMPQLPDDVHLVLAGNGPDKPMLEQKTAELGLQSRVHFNDWVNSPDVPDFLAALDVFTFPSVYEGFGLSLIEAAQQSLPIAASDIGIFRELLGGKDGEAQTAGRLFALDKPEDWVAGIMALKNQPDHARALGQKALERSRLFSFAAMSENYKKALKLS